MEKSIRGLIKPKKLVQGDKVIAVSPSFGAAFLFPKRFQAGCDQIEQEFGIKVVPSKNALRDPDWLSANPQARADDIIEALEDKSVKGMICSIGGEDSIRVNQFINPEIIKRHPKMFMGYSDATTTHLWMYKAGLVSFYGPTIMAGFAENHSMPAYMKEYVYKNVFSSQVIGKIQPNQEGWTTEFLDWAVESNQNIQRRLQPSVGPLTLQGTGKFKGHLIGGCVEVLEMLRGTEYWPEPSEFDGAILFLETAESEFLPMYFARAMRSYGVMGILDRISGIIMGRPGGNLPVEKFAEFHRTLQKIVREEFNLPNLPLIVNMDFGHTDPMFTLPYGLLAEADCGNHEIDILESAVTG